MKEQARWFIRSVFSPAALSNRALVIWAPFPILAAILLMPFGVSAGRPATWAAAIGVQVLFSLIVMAGRSVTRNLVQRHPRPVVIAVIVIAGAVRGAVLMQASAILGGVDVAPIELALRGINSAIIALLALGLIGVMLQFTRDYQGQYEELRDRAIRLQREAVAPAQTLSDATIASWVGVQRSLQTTASTARQELADVGVSARSLRAVADVIADVLTKQVRPISHGLWSGSSDAPPRLRAHLVAWDALRPWKPPLATITALVAAVTFISSVNRAGLAAGGLYALFVTVVVVAIIAASIAAGRRLPRSRAVGVVTLILIPIAVVAVAIAVSEGILGTPPDVTGSVILGVSLTLGVGGTVFLRRVTAEREALLIALQARIDAQAVDVLSKRAESDSWGKSLGTFVHHSVQSELTALRMQLMEAAVIDDHSQRAATRTDALARFDRLLALQPPWVEQRAGRTVVAEVAQAWAGIAEVTVTATDAGTEDQWAIAGHVVEEGVANAVRAGGARQVRVDIAPDIDDALVITIQDDGSGISDPINPGLGTWWLDQIAPNAWERRSSPSGTSLIVRVG